MKRGLAFDPWRVAFRSISCLRRPTRRRPVTLGYVSLQRIEKLEQRALLAAAGSLDPSFNGSGQVTTAFGTGLDQANDLAVQSDGRIVAVGFSANSTDRDFAIARYSATGALDTSFNSTGLATFNFGTTSIDQATSVAVQGDGRIVIAGFSTSGLTTRMAVLRLNADGTLDTSFNGTGHVLTQIGNSLLNQANDLAIQNDGRIVAAGSSGSVINQSFALVRYNTDGSLDTSLGGTGQVTTTFSLLGLGVNQANAITLQNDGKIVTAGVAVNGTDNNFALVRYNTDGSLDTAFDGDGRVQTNFGTQLLPDTANGLAIQSDGNIVAVGTSISGTNNAMAIARYNTKGALDTTFNGTGTILTAVGGALASMANDVAIQDDGKIVVDGSVLLSGSENAFALARYNTDGTLDPVFGTGGTVITTFGNLSDSATAVALQPDGKILAAGSSTLQTGSVSHFAIASYIGDNHAPTLANLTTPVSATAGTNVTFTVAATDPEGDPITYSANNLPSGATFNTTTRVFSWTPSAGQAPGQYVPQFTVSDGSLSSSQTVTINVNSAVNQPPVLAPIGNQSVNAGNLLSLAIAASDSENNPLTYSATNLPAGATFDASTHVFTWTPADNQGPGNYTVTFQVSDGTGTDSETIDIAVVGGTNNTNPGPTFNTIGAKTVGVNSNLTFTVSATDPNNDPLVYSTANMPAGATFNPSTRVFSWTPTPTQGPGNFQVQFFVTDGTTSASQTVPITVTGGTNQAPVFNAITDKTVAVGSSLDFSVSATDPDGNPLTYSASNLPSGATFNPASRTFHWAPTASQGPGNYTVTFLATDGGLTSTTTAQIAVTGGTNRAPVFSNIADQSVEAGHNLSFTVSATDPDGSPLNFGASNLPSGASFNPTTHVFSWTPAANQAGAQYNPIFTASDGALVSSISPTITVTAVVSNQPPVLAAIGNKSVNAGSPLTFTVSATDPESDALTFSATALPGGATFNASSRTFTWTPSASQGPANYSVTFGVSDGISQDSETIQIAVVGGTIGGNAAPVFNAVNPQTVAANTPLTFTVSAVDPNGDPLTYSASSLPAGATFNAATRTFSWTPASAQGPGSYSVQFHVTDGTGNDDLTVPISVTAGTNRAPTIAAIGDKTIMMRQPLSFVISASDPDGNPLTYSASSLPARATFNPSTHQFQWTPVLAQGPGTYPVTFAVNDGALTTTQTIQVTVTGGTNRAPVISPVDDQSVERGETLTVTISATDPDGDLLTYSVINLPSGATFNSTTHVLSYTPGTNQVPKCFMPTFTVSDGALESSVSFHIEVTVNGQGPFTRLYRAYNPNIGLHFFTSSYNEFQQIVQAGLTDESHERGGIGVLLVQDIGSAPLHRLYNPNNGEHYYTLSDVERDHLVMQGWTFERDEGFLYEEPTVCTSPIYRLYNEAFGGHLFTENPEVRDHVLSQFPGIWMDTAILGYGEILNPGAGYPQGVVTSPVSAHQTALEMAGAAMAPAIAASSFVASPEPSSGATADGTPAVASNVNADPTPQETAESSLSETGVSSNSTTSTDDAEGASGAENMDDFWTALGQSLANGSEPDMFS